MGSTTAAPGSFPYPVGTDRVMDGDNAIQALADRISATANIPAAGLSFGAGFSQYAGFAICRYYKVHEVVFLEGLVQCAGNAGTICNLPVGFRPSTTQLYGAFSSLASNIARIDIDAAGNVATQATVIGFISLSGIAFRTGSF